MKAFFFAISPQGHQCVKLKGHRVKIVSQLLSRITDPGHTRSIHLAAVCSQMTCIWLFQLVNCLLHMMSDFGSEVATRIQSFTKMH